MIFNSYSFIAFIGVVLLVYYALSNWTQRKLLLLIASYFFYAVWNPPFVLLLLLSTWVQIPICIRFAHAATLATASCGATALG